MRIFLIGTAAGALAIAAPAAPAFAQYGGSPDQQVDGDPADPDDIVYADASLEADYADDVADKVEAQRDAEWPYGGEVPYAAVDLPDDAEQAGPGDPYEGAYAAEDMDGPDDAEGAGTWQGEDGRTYCRRSDGTTGLIVGGGAGALIGRSIDRPSRRGWRGRRGGGRGTGTILGAIAGALVGSAIERSANEQRCQ